MKKSSIFFTIIFIVIIFIITFNVVGDKGQKVFIDINFFQIVDLKNPSKCFDELYPWERGICLRWNAAFHKEEGYCNFVEEKDGKQFCYNLLAAYLKNNKYCNQTEDANYCNVEVEAINKNDPSICERVSGNTGNCYRFISLVFEDWDLCYRSSDTPQCLMNIIIKKNNLDLCKNIQGDNSYCYAYFAIKTKNSDLCSKSIEFESCYYPVAVNLLNLSLCSKTGNKEDSCISNVISLKARAANNPEECDTAGNWAGNCYQDMALVTGSSELCKKSGWEEGCLELLKMKKNATNTKLKFMSIQTK